MKIPKYVVELMTRAKYEYDRCVTNDNYATGYTIKICKATDQTMIWTLQKEVERLVAWANRQVENEEGIQTAYLLHIPAQTHYCPQFAVVTIYDPVMKEIEKYIPKEE